MPYGLSNALSVFQEFIHRFVIVYIDDILIYSRNLADHRHHVAQVLQKLRQFRLYLKLEKCEFHRPTVQFLGYIIGREGIQMDQGKVTAVAEWPTPQTIKELQRFLGFANFYRRFIKGFSLLTASLTTLLRGKPKSLSWISNAHEAFDSLTYSPSSRPPCTIRGGSRRLHHRGQGCAIPTVWWASTPPALRILFQETDLSRAKFWHRKQGATSHQACPRRVATLAGGSKPSFHCHHRSQKSPIPPASEEAQPQTSPLGFVL